MHLSLNKYIRWGLALSLVLVATACRDSSDSGIAEVDTSYITTQGARTDEPSSYELSLETSEFNDDNNSGYNNIIVHQESASSEAVPSFSENKKALGLDDRTRDKTVRLVVDSITLNDCVMRGEIRNYSKDQYARDVTVTVSALDSEENIQWHWPLTVEPGESAPFEINIDWFPHTYDYDSSDQFRQRSLNMNQWNLFGNTYVDVEAKLSPVPDLKRAFEFNSDDTEVEILYQNTTHKFLIYDERALELEESKAWSRYGRQYSVISKPLFAFVFPGDMVKGNDAEPMISEFSLYKYTDVFYVPSRIYPDIYEAGEAYTVSDVRVYQAYKHGSRVIDVRELLPHSLVEGVSDEGLLINRKLTPVSDFTNFDISDGERIYLQLLDPYHFSKDFPIRNVNGEASTHQDDIQQVSVWGDLWIGGASHSEISPNGKPSIRLVDPDSNSCYALGPLCVGDFVLQGYIAVQIIDALGRTGACHSFETEAENGETIAVDYDSVTLLGQDIRGLIYNPSGENVARDVKVTASHKDSDTQLGTWRWPLALQPGEYAPFEITLQVSDLSIKQIEFQVSAQLSENADPTRSFLVETYIAGTVYGTDFLHLYEETPFAFRYPTHYEIKPGQFLDHNAIILTPGIRYTKEQFLELYRGAILSENLEGLELFSFQDLYARLEPPDSHPELAKIATNQYIHNLRAYAAIFDQNGRVVDVKEVPLFTPVYGRANISEPYVEVDSIPAPNRWSPNAVRIMQIVPYEDEADMNKGYYSQVWIGGATEPVG